jgi:hypothetical protein
MKHLKREERVSVAVLCGTPPNACVLLRVLIFVKRQVILHCYNDPIGIPCHPQINKFGRKFGGQGAPMLVGAKVDTATFGGQRSGVSK